MHFLHALVLPRQHLRFAPINAVNLRLAFVKRAEIVVFGGVFQRFFKIIAVEIFADVAVPLLGGGAVEHAVDNHTAAFADIADLFGGNVAVNDVVGLKLGNRVAARSPYGFDFLHLRADVGFHFVEHPFVIGQCGFQLLFGCFDGGAYVGGHFHMCHFISPLC